MDSLTSNSGNHSPLCCAKILIPCQDEGTMKKNILRLLNAYAFILWFRVHSFEEFLCCLIPFRLSQKYKSQPNITSISDSRIGTFLLFFVGDFGYNKLLRKGTEREDENRRCNVAVNNKNQTTENQIKNMPPQVHLVSVALSLHKIAEFSQASLFARNLSFPVRIFFLVVKIIEIVCSLTGTHRHKYRKMEQKFNAHKHSNGNGLTELLAKQTAQLLWSKMAKQQFSFFVALFCCGPKCASCRTRSEVFLRRWSSNKNRYRRNYLNVIDYRTWEHQQTHTKFDVAATIEPSKKEHAV